VVFQVDRIVNPQLVVPEIDDEFDRPARQNPFFEMRLSVIVVEPKVVDEVSERRRRFVRPVQHQISLKETNRSP
jgi:hypothetical protein